MNLLWAYAYIVIHWDIFPYCFAWTCRSDSTCIICREEMTTAKKLICGHLFHVHCLRSWLERQHTCPTCRALVVPPENGASTAGVQHGQRPDTHQSGNLLITTFIIVVNCLWWVYSFVPSIYVIFDIWSWLKMKSLSLSFFYSLSTSIFYKLHMVVVGGIFLYNFIVLSRIFYV